MRTGFLAVGCVLFLGLGLSVGGWAFLATLREEGALRHLRAGEEALSRGDWADAAAELRGTLSSSDPAVGGAGHHNLGLALLSSSLEAEGAEALSHAREALVHLEEALRLQPGLPPGAWNLELALRRVRELQEEEVRKGTREAQRLLASFGLLEGGRQGDPRRPPFPAGGQETIPALENGPPW